MKGAALDPSLVAVHDLLVTVKAPDVEHGPANCGICAARAAEEEGIVADETFTKAEFDAALETAMAPVRAELDTLRQAHEAGEVERLIAEAVDPVKAELAEAQAKLDVAEAQVASLTEERDALVAAEAERAAAETAAAERESRKEARIAEAKEIAKFTDEQIAEKADRWAEMADDAWAGLLEGFREAAALAPTAEVTPFRGRSPLVASDAGGGKDGDMDTVREAMSIRRTRGVHPRAI